ncbi:YihY/virulence factor BrkB family protein [Flavihumibacter solisilvae]|uniref:Ribonuclease BN n=1 Tax=Flavihumibacter solisilvae TaxID=1349421 RepID=A0A0C1L831_9BACT|nr:YihY/virulence factor BrkB family protein [Flavihumibacter solisilvae]KIC96322.1 ribonuclease BN [Flavihumibacter solisilvae]
MKRIGDFFRLIKTAAKSFIEDDAMKLSASLSYYTVFALGPVLLLIISLAGIFWGREALEGKIFHEIRGLVGNSAAYQVQHMIGSLARSENTTAGAVVGIIMLVIGATGVFTEIQSSINYIWSIRAKPKKGLVRLLLNRLISFSLVVATSFILLVALIINALVELLNDKLASIFPDTAVIIFNILNYITIYVVITALFTIIFRVLPDASISWKDAIRGAAFTAILFLLGKFAIGFYIGNASFGKTYGTAASIIIILVWVYYSSVILYFGASFTKAYSLRYGSGIKPDKSAVFIIKRESKEVPVN